MNKIYDLNEIGIDASTTELAKRHSAFFNSSHDGILVFCPDGMILDANPRLLNMCGKSYDALMGMNVFDLFDETTIPNLKKSITCLKQNRPRQQPLRCRLKTGNDRPLFAEISLSPLENQYGYSWLLLAMVRDISRRVRFEAEYQRQAHELSSVFQAIADPLFVINDQRVIRRLNRAALEMCAVKKIEATGRKVGDVLRCTGRHSSSRGCMYGDQCRKCRIRESVMRCLKLGQTVLNQESTLQTESADHLSVFRTNAVPVAFQGRKGCVLSIVDITGFKEAEKKAAEMHANITRANLELKQSLENLMQSQSLLFESRKMEQIGLLASGLAHNLKSPLAGIKGYAQLMQMEEPRRELELIIRQTDVMENIINNLMTKSRQDHTERPEPLNLNQLLITELEFFESNMFFKHRVTRNMELTDNLPLIEGVYAHFSQTFNNIIQNSIDAMHESDKREFTVRSRFDGANVCVDFEDSGCGIPPENQSKIFDPFYSTKPSRNDRKEGEPFGTGLGLSSARFIMQQYGVTIRVSSQVGRGTCVTLQIPVRVQEETGTRKAVLIVDDSQTMVDILTQVCENMNLEVYGAYDGESALSLYQSIRPEILVTDLCLPGLLGSELVQEIRKITPDQKVVYITGYSENPDYQAWLNQEKEWPQTSRLLNKPFTLESFRQTMETMLEYAQAEK